LQWAKEPKQSEQSSVARAKKDDWEDGARKAGSQNPTDSPLLILIDVWPGTLEI